MADNTYSERRIDDEQFLASTTTLNGRSNAENRSSLNMAVYHP